jgi:Transglutaminase-like superfamily
VRAFLRRARVLKASIRSPGDVWLGVRMLGWRMVLPVLKRALPLPRLARLMWTPSSGQGREPAREERIATLANGLGGRRRGRLDNCLERSLVAYRYLSRAGARPELVVGVARKEDDGGVRGHAWIRVDGRPFHEPARSLDGFEEMTAFGGDGTMVAG